MEPLNVMNAPKTGTFQMRINPQIKAQVEQIYEKSGLTTVSYTHLDVYKRQLLRLPFLR